MNAKTDTSTALPLPTLTLRVGGLGNMKFAEGEDSGFEMEAAAASREVLRCIDEILHEIHQEDRGTIHGEIHSKSWYWLKSRLGLLFGQCDRWGTLQLAGKSAAVFSDAKPRIKLLTGTAGGADTIIHRAGEEHQASGTHHCSCEGLRVVVDEVDFDAPHEVRDSTDGITNDQAHHTDVLHVGRIPMKTNDGGNYASLRRNGFRAQAEALRHHSDVLLAIWNPDADGRAGGTVETVQRALEAGIPVIAVRLRSQGTVISQSIAILRQPDDLHHPQQDTEEWRHHLHSVLEDLLKFPESGEHHAGHAKHPSAYKARRVFASFIQNAPVRNIWIGCFWKWFDRVATFMSRGEAAEVIEPKRMPKNYGPAYERHYGHVLYSRSGREMPLVFGRAHRGGVLLSYALAALAVCLAVAGMVLHCGSLPIAIAAAEVMIILFMWALATCSKLDDWHEAYTDTRLLTEALRMMQYLGPLGVHAPMPRLPNHLSKDPDEPQPERSWAMWYMRCLVRMAPMRLGNATPDPEYAALRDAVTHDWLQGQIKHHQRTAAKYEWLHEWVEKVSGLLFLLIAVAAIEHFLHLLHLLPDGEGYWSSVVCICGPALIAALHGFTSQIEANRLRKRSASTSELLKEAKGRIMKLDMHHAADQCAAWSLATESRDPAAIMMEEAAGWALLYKGADIHAG